MHGWPTLPENQALEIVARQGFGSREQFGPKAPNTVKALAKILEDTRRRGYSTINEMFAPGMSAMAAAIQRPGEAAIGVITIAGPLIRLTESRMQELGPALMAISAELALASTSSPIFERYRVRETEAS